MVLEIVHDFLGILDGKLLVAGILAAQVIEGAVIKHGGQVGVILFREAGNIVGESLDGIIRPAQVRVRFTQQIHGRLQVGAVPVFLDEAFQHGNGIFVASSISGSQVEQGSALAIQGQFIELVGGIALVQFHDLVRLLNAKIELLVFQQAFQGQGIQGGGVLGIREFLDMLGHQLPALVRFPKLPGGHGQVEQIVFPARGIRIEVINELVGGAGNALRTMHHGLVAHEIEREGIQNLAFLLHLVELLDQGVHL